MSGMRPSVLVSILSWESPRYLTNLLDNLEALSPSHENRAAVHIHVLDQGSGEETRGVIRRFMAGGNARSASFLTRNIGFARGHNRVFDDVYRRVRFDYFVIVNQDVLFGHPGWVDQLIEGMQDPEVAVGGPVVWHSSDRPGVLMETLPQPDPGRIFSVQASVAIIRTAAIERFGLFDAVFTPAYFEDSDLCRRYVHAGCRLAWIPIQHVHAYFGNGEKLIRRKREELLAEHGDYHARNRALFRRRWMNGPVPPVIEDSVQLQWPNVYRPQRGSDGGSCSP